MLIKPHGSTELAPRIVEGDAAAALKNEAATLPTLVLSSAAAANAVMLGAGYFNPLQGYMNRDWGLAGQHDHLRSRQTARSCSRLEPAKISHQWSED